MLLVIIITDNDQFSSCRYFCVKTERKEEKNWKEKMWLDWFYLTMYQRAFSYEAITPLHSCRTFILYYLSPLFDTWQYLMIMIINNNKTHIMPMILSGTPIPPQRRSLRFCWLRMPVCGNGTCFSFVILFIPLLFCPLYYFLWP